ncbi:MAG TPA: gliding motility-associated ABC transporter substrate-binding protein GldG [Chitinophagales bacterium]|nr:gliding motility-associated ABC transporter substrate-binding protein GldG [Chitinophagales bacterium]
MKKHSVKYQAIYRFAAAVVFIVLFNITAQQYYKRLDLTKERRYTLSNATKELLRNLDDVVYVRIYLEGEFPAGFKRLRNSARDLLDEFKYYSRRNIEYVFINPNAGSVEDRKAVYKELTEKGLQPTNLRVKGDEELSQRIIFPGALFIYRGQELPVLLLENQIGLGPQEVLNNSAELLEYKFANAIKKLTQRTKPLILFSRGQGELQDRKIQDIVETLQELQYRVDTVNLTTELIPRQANVLIVAKPTRKFREQEKFKLDQFIMNGGSVLWLLDVMNAEMDSLRGKSVYLSLPRDLNLDDQLFKYGVRLNTDLVQDLQCNRIPLVVGMLGDQPQTELFPWYYFPLITPGTEHALVRNLDAIALQFAGTIDTVGKRDSQHIIHKIPLLRSSPHSKALLSPVRLHFSMLQEPPDVSAFNQKNLLLGVLLEGKFESVFKNRVAETFMQALDSINQPFRDESIFSKMIVVADGDVIRNDTSSTGAIYPLGYWRFTDQTFANKDFILNCIEYLADDTRLIETRNKEIRLRLLNNQKVKKEKTKWQLVNTGVPLLLVILFGLFYNWLRKKRYAK